LEDAIEGKNKDSIAIEEPDSEPAFNPSKSSNFVKSLAILKSKNATLELPKKEKKIKKRKKES